jgi:hypothetical protein
MALWESLELNMVTLRTAMHRKLEGRDTEIETAPIQIRFPQ